MLDEETNLEGVLHRLLNGYLKEFLNDSILNTCIWEDRSLDILGVYEMSLKSLVSENWKVSSNSSNLLSYPLIYLKY